MELTRVERWILANQLRILAKLDKESTEHYEHHAVSLERGYEYDYSEACQHIAKGDDVVSVEESKFVYEVLDLYRTLGGAYARLNKPEDIDADDILFPGFDGNNESKLLGYADHLCKGGERYGEALRDGHIPNSHMRTIQKYQRMLSRWDGMNKSRELSKEQLLEILG